MIIVPPGRKLSTVVSITELSLMKIMNSRNRDVFGFFGDACNLSQKNEASRKKKSSLIVNGVCTLRKFPERRDMYSMSKSSLVSANN